MGSDLDGMAIMAVIGDMVVIGDILITILTHIDLLIMQVQDILLHIVERHTTEQIIVLHILVILLIVEIHIVELLITEVM